MFTISYLNYLKRLQKKTNSYKKIGLLNKGFTLIEMMVAVTLLAIISLMSFKTLSALLNTQNSININQIGQNQFNQLIAQFYNDCLIAQHLSPLSSMPGLILYQPKSKIELAFINSSNSFEAIKNSTTNHLNKIIYFVKDNQLYRQLNQNMPVFLLPNIKTVNVNYYQNNNWQPLTQDVNQANALQLNLQFINTPLKNQTLTCTTALNNLYF